MCKNLVINTRSSFKCPYRVAKHAHSSKHTVSAWFNLPPINPLTMERNQLYTYSSSSFQLMPLFTPHVSTTICQPNPPPRKTSLYTYPPSTPRCGFPWGKKPQSFCGFMLQVSFLCVGIWPGDAVTQPTATHKHSLRNM